jgi:hypothetical protein
LIFGGDLAALKVAGEAAEKGKLSLKETETASEIQFTSLLDVPHM